MERIIINGFFGKGNCGDEAILHTWYEKLSPEFRIVASVDSDLFERPGNFENNKIYQSIDLIHNRRLDIFCREDIKAYIIGGGGLGLGFGIEQWLHASIRNKKMFYLGTIVHEEFLIGDEHMYQINKNFFKSFNYIMVRDHISKKNLKEKFGVDSDNYPDIAFALTPEKTNFSLPKKFMTVTVRDNGNNDKDSIMKWLEKIKKFAKERTCEIIYLPFDKTDKFLLKSIGIEIPEEYQQIYWQPKMVKYIMSKAEMVFSLGRFHPLVFSLSTGVTCYYIQCQETDYSWRYDKNTQDKSFNILNDWGLSKHYLTNDDIDCKFRKNSKFYAVAVESQKRIIEFFEVLKQKLTTNYD